MLVRSNGGRWCQAEQVASLPGDAITGLLDGDLAALLELDEPRHVIARSLRIHGERGPDAICVGRDGELAIVVAASGDDEPERVVMRCAVAAGTMAGWSLEKLLGHCEQPTLAPHVDPAGVEANLAAGRFELLVLVDGADERLAAALRWLERGAARVSCFTLELHRSASMEALQPRELALDASHAPPREREEQHEPVRVPHADVPLYEVIGGPGFDDVADVTPEPEPEPEAPAVLMPAGPAWSPHGRIA